VIKSDVTSRLQESHGRESQTLRKSVVQTTFRELYGLEVDRLALRPTRPDQLLPAPKDPSLTHIGDFGRPWVTPATALERGSLIEVEVDLKAEPIYQVSSAFSTMFEIMRENPGFVATGGLEGLVSMEWVSQFLEKMLDGLVPVRGEIVDYALVTVDSTEYVMHRRALAELDGAPITTARPLCLVGVAAEALFWKDIRRVLFGGDRYRVLCRLTQSGVQESWKPVKLAEVFRAIVPEAARGFDELNRMALDLQSSVAQPQIQSPDAMADRHLQTALLAYAGDLAAAHGAASDESFSEGVSEIVGSLDRTDLTQMDVKARRAVFGRVTKLVEERLEVTVDPSQAATFRTASYFEAISSSVPGPLTMGGAPPPLTPSQDAPAFIDVELIAIYW
jgi:hypothetical protein